jgi:hypothetical protein
MLLFGDDAYLSRRCHIIGMDRSYAIEPDEKGGFLVRATSPTDSGDHIVGFSTTAEAQVWIDDRIRFANVDPSPVP